jgi:hypothetical protein
VAQALFDIGVQQVVAIEGDQSVYEVAAVTFFNRFYRSLLTGAAPEAAFAAGQRAVRLDHQLARLGAVAPQREAAKFKLLPVGGDHDQPLLPTLETGGQVQIQSLPRPSHHALQQRPPLFVGRNDDLLAVIRRLRQQGALLIQGASGVGKSELARETAHRLVERRRAHPDRCFFVNLANTQSVAAARQQIALELGLREALPEGEGPANQRLAQALAAQSLLILDEAENLIQQGGLAVRNLLEALAQALSRPLLLVTSQSDVGSRHLPVLRLERLTPSAAVALFVHASDLSEAELKRINPSELEELLGYVDRLPRAIELVGRVWRYQHSADLRPLLAELRQRHDQVLADPRYPDEVKSVTVGIQLAYDRLRQAAPAAAQLYVWLALFPGGLPETGVEAIFGPAARRQLAQIEDQSLVERPYADLVYLPTPFRSFAQRQLPAGPAEAQQQLGEAVLGFYDAPNPQQEGWVGRLDQALQSAGEAMGALIVRYTVELPSIESWLDWGYDHEAPTTAGSRSARLTARLQNLYGVTGQLRLERRRFERALAAARRGQDRLGEANVQKALGDLELREDKLEAARQRYLAALAIYPQIGARLGEANMRQSIGNLALAENDPAAAFSHYRAALEIQRAIGNQLGVGACFGYLGRAAASADSHTQAVVLFDQCITLYRQISELFSQAIVLDWQANSFLALEDQQAALGAWWQALGLAQRIGLPLAQQLQGLFAQIAQNAGEQWPPLQAELQAQAEAWRRAGVAAAQTALRGQQESGHGVDGPC